jgi:hypothetical protein
VEQDFTVGFEALQQLMMIYRLCIILVIMLFFFFQKSEVSLVTQQACGLVHSSGHERPNSIAAMINAREV